MAIHVRLRHRVERRKKVDVSIMITIISTWIHPPSNTLARLANQNIQFLTPSSSKKLKRRVWYRQVHHCRRHQRGPSRTRKARLIIKRLQRLPLYRRHTHHNLFGKPGMSWKAR